MINNSVYILCKQDGVKITRMHICTWNVKNKISFTEYGFEIDRGTLKKLDLLVALPEINKKEVTIDQNKDNDKEEKTDTTNSADEDDFDDDDDGTEIPADWW